MPPKGKMIGEVLNLSGALSILMMNLLLLSGRFCTVSVIIFILIWPIVIFGLSSFAPIFVEILFVFSKDFLAFDILEDHTDIQ